MGDGIPMSNGLSMNTEKCGRSCGRCSTSMAYAPILALATTGLSSSFDASLRTAVRRKKAPRICGAFSIHYWIRDPSSWILATGFWILTQILIQSPDGEVEIRGKGNPHHIGRKQQRGTPGTGAYFNPQCEHGEEKENGDNDSWANAVQTKEHCRPTNVGERVDERGSCKRTV